MILEALWNWNVQAIQYAISLLPDNGSLFASIPSLSYTFLKYITVLNGYIPVKEIGNTLVIIFGVYASMYTIRIIFGLYSLLTKLIP